MRKDTGPDKSGGLFYKETKSKVPIIGWIEQVKGQAMAGATLTDDFWANDILW